MDLIPEFKKILECDEIHKVFVPIPKKSEKDSARQMLTEIMLV